MVAANTYGILLSNPEASPYDYYTDFLEKFNQNRKTSGFLPTFFLLYASNYFFLASVLTFLTTFFAGAFLTIFFTGAFATGLAITLATDLVAFFPRYLESSKARIGMNTTFTKSKPSPNAQCFQKFFAMLK